MADFRGADADDGKFGTAFAKLLKALRGKTPGA
jgi:hypothetical protein